jgi:gluconate 2-dehydrogenase gamma chain
MSGGSKSAGHSRRQVLIAGAALAALGEAGRVEPARAETLAGKLPWRPGAVSPPHPADTTIWHFFAAEEVASIEALVDRLIPPDPQTPGGKDAGCAAFIDEQLAGSFGSAQGLYMEGPFEKGAPQQGPQGQATPAEIYRVALKSLDSYCRARFAGKVVATIDAASRDLVLSGLEQGTISLEGVDARLFFELLLQNTMEGFFADPIYGGNRDMAGWKMIGFPGARYDCRDHVGKHNQPYPLPPVSILGRSDWSDQL